MQRSSFALAVAAGSVSYEIDTDRARLDLAMIHDFLARSPWGVN